jgi:hypothetical protein
MQGADPGGLRISDADRDQISGVLSEHAAEGRLTMDELEQRLGKLYASETRAQAGVLVADLPPLADAGDRHHFHLGDEHGDPVPRLPDWLTVDATPPAPSAVSRLRAATSGARPAPREDKAEMRRRTKRRADENAIGHAFQAKRRAINDERERALAAGKTDDVARLNEALREADETATSARQAAATGDRAKVQQLLARLRSGVA